MASWQAQLLRSLVQEAQRRRLNPAPILDSLKTEAKRRGLSGVGDALQAGVPLIAPEVTFRQWCEAMGRAGLCVDGHRFTLENRRSLWEVYDQIPATVDQAFGKTLVLQKGSQMGLTVFEILANIYMAVKFAPCKVLMYLPDRSLAGYKSAQRFMPIIRSLPSVHALVTQGSANEGNTLTRVMPAVGSNFLFLWTRGREGGVSESFPGDVLSLDETQGMTLEQIDRVSERLSASRIRYRLMLSTPLWPELDINAWYLAGDQRKFHTRCGCADGIVLTDVFLEAALRNTGRFPVYFNDGRWPDAPLDYIYYCPTCEAWIPDPQDGVWVAHRPEATVASYHMSQILSPTISPREVLEGWLRADTADRRQNFFCRKLGTPYADPSQILATLEILRACAEAGQRLGVRWKTAASGAFLGVDQMGGFSVATVAERLPDGRMAVIHVEAVYALDPWARLDEIMAAYGVVICVVEQLPNIDSARAFAHRHQGRVWLITSYGDLEEFVAWGDVLVTKSDRKTGGDYRDRYTLRADQYRVMDWAASRFREQYIVFPDPLALVQEVREGGVGRPAPVLSDMFWLHYTKTGLVLAEDEEQRKIKRKVIKLGLDPHASFSLMCVCLAWFRSFGTASFILPGASGSKDTPAPDEALQRAMPGVPGQVLSWVAEVANSATCGRCVAFQAGLCQERGLQVGANDPACDWFVAK